MNEINREFKSYLVVPFNFTTGDEFQGLMNELKAANYVAILEAEKSISKILADFQNRVTLSTSKG